MHGTTLLTSALCAILTGHGAMAHAGVFAGEAFKVTELHSGNFSVTSVDMRPAAWPNADAETVPAWHAGETVQVTVKGTTAKEILAGTFKYQIYETGTKSFIASGNSPYFKCDNKGCDTDAPIALHWDKGEDTKGAFTLDMNLALPKMTSASKEFRLVLWGEDQDHFPYDFTATLTFDYTKAAENALLTSYNSMPEPASCIREATKLCGHTTAKTWPACAYEHMSQLRKAGCKGNPIGASEDLSAKGATSVNMYAEALTQVDTAMSCSAKIRRAVQKLHQSEKCKRKVVQVCCPCGDGKSASSKKCWEQCTVYDKNRWDKIWAPAGCVKRAEQRRLRSSSVNFLGHL